MEFKVKAFKPNNNSYSKDELDIAYKFSTRSMKEFGKFIKAIVIFGSITKREHKKTNNNRSDIDILHIIDDVSVILSQELTNAYAILSKKLVKEVSPRIHLTTLTFSSFWEFIKVGDPIAINMLRDGMPIIDTGFFTPLQKLLFQGRIRPTEESIWTYFSRAPRTLTASRMHLIRATVDLYWAVIDSAHAALMKIGEIPPSPDHVADLMQKRLIKEKEIDKKYVSVMKNFYKVSKMIEHRELSEITGQEYEKYYKDAEEFVKAMQNFIDKKSHLTNRHI